MNGGMYNYEYDSFGSGTVESDSKAADFRFRFSSKYLGPDSGLYYYGHRYYRPKIGRWLSRDPIGEGDAPGLYSLLRNDPINKVDYLGLESLCHCFKSEVELVIRQNLKKFATAAYAFQPVANGGVYDYSGEYTGLFGFKHKDYVNWISVAVIPNNFHNGVVKYDPDHCECGAGDVSTLPYKPRVEIIGPWATSEWAWNVAHNFVGQSAYDYYITQNVLRYKSPYTMHYTVNVYVEEEVCSTTEFSIQY